MSGPTRLRLHLTPAAETAVRLGHPWVFANRIREQNRAGTLGELAVLYDRADRFLALGLYDPHSPIRVRILHAGDPVTLDSAWWRQRLEAVIQQRAALFDATTTGWRVIHGENDGWPGLVLDRYGDTWVLKLYSAAWLPRLDEILGLLVDLRRPRSVVLRLSRNIADIAGKEFKRTDGQILRGDPITAPVVFLENGLRFEAEVVRGQKTGFFLDQRENRARVGNLASGAAVLNAFSFSGAFSVYAARGGAVSVTDIDVSPHALESARRNFLLNREIPAVAATRRETIQADVFEWLRIERSRMFDLVILDPPSLARRESERAGAMAAYEKLIRFGAVRLRPGGLLLACSCSAHVTAEDFFAIAQKAVRDARRSSLSVETTRHPPDHPARFPEAHYLKAIYLRLA